MPGTINIRKAIYTTNAIESLNSVIKKRKVFPTDDSVRKVIYLAIFYLRKKEPKGRKNKGSRYGIARPSQIKDASSAAKEPWLIFSSTNDFKPREIMKLYSRRMQIEQNFRDEKSERFGFGLRASYSRSAGRVLVLSLLATLSTIVLWLTGYHAENQGLHLRYQANSIKTRRVISYLTLAENVLRHSPLILKRTVLSTVLNHLARTNQNMVLVY